MSRYKNGQIPAVTVGTAISGSYPTAANWGAGSTLYFSGTYKAAA